MKSRRQKSFSDWYSALILALNTNKFEEIINIFDEHEFKTAIFSFIIKDELLKLDDSLLKTINYFVNDLIRKDMCKENKIHPNIFFYTFVYFCLDVEYHFNLEFQSIKNDLTEKDCARVNNFVISLYSIIQKMLFHLSLKPRFSVDLEMANCLRTYYSSPKESSVILNQTMALLEIQVNYDRVISRIFETLDKRDMLRCVKEILETKKNVNIKCAHAKTGKTLLHRLVQELHEHVAFQMYKFPFNTIHWDKEICQLISFLLAYDASCLEVKDKKGKTPLNGGPLAKSKVEEIALKEKDTRSLLRNSLLCYAGFFKKENNQSCLHSLPEDLIKKIGFAILDNSSTDLNPSEESLKEYEDLITYPRLSWR